jgi:hypothetical protein
VVRFGAFVFVVACAIAAVGSALAATSPSALRAAILRAELVKRSVHYVTRTSEAGMKAREVADVGAGRGIQRISFSKGGKTGHVTEIVVPGKAYLRGDASGLRALGFPASVASGYAGKWVSIPPSSSLYAPSARDVTIDSFVRDGVPESQLSLVSGTVGGKAMRGLRGTAPEGGILTVYVPESGPPLVVQGTEVETGAHASRGRVILSRWNEPVHVQAPVHSVPIQYP